MNDYQKLQQLDRSLQTFRKSGAYKRINTELSDSDIMVLFCVAFCDVNEKIKLSDISRTLRVTLPAVTHKVNDLYKKGYITKDASKEDLRVTYIELTHKGLKYVNEIKASYYKPLKDLTSLLGEEDTNTLIRILSKIANMER